MRNKLNKITLAAGFLLALAFTFSCHDGGGSNEDGTSSSGTKISSSGGTGGKQSSSSETTVNPSSSGKSSSSGVVSSSSGGSSSGGTASADTSGTFKDSRDNQTYKWVKIGTQIWMAQNLNYFEPWVGTTRGNKCYDNKDANCEKYGRLYEWDDAIRVCPDGWHLPTKVEWDALISTVGSDAGKKLKSTSSDWIDGAGTDIYGFGALPGGYLDGEFQHINTAGNWWTSTEQGSGSYEKYMTAGNGVLEGGRPRTHQYSVRCVEGYSSSSSIAYGEFIDKRDNKKYATVKIGLQNWMAQNLNYAGTNPQIGLCYNNKTENCNKYGRLYTWASAMNVSEDYNSKVLNAPPGQHQGICPDGWHLPTKSEWNILIDYVGADAGKKLKTRSSEWGDNYGTNIYGFGALPGGYLDGEFQHLNIASNWWTSTENDYGRASEKYIMNPNNLVVEAGRNKTHQYSVRCVED